MLVPSGDFGVKKLCNLMLVSHSSNELSPDAMLHRLTDGVCLLSTTFGLVFFQDVDRQAVGQYLRRLATLVDGGSAPDTRGRQDTTVDEPRPV